jgi:hypothetical protein
MKTTKRTQTIGRKFTAREEFNFGFWAAILDRKLGSPRRTATVPALGCCPGPLPVATMPDYCDGYNAGFDWQGSLEIQTSDAAWERFNESK